MAGAREVMAELDLSFMRVVDKTPAGQQSAAPEALANNAGLDLGFAVKKGQPQIGRKPEHWLMPDFVTGNDRIPAAEAETDEVNIPASLFFSNPKAAGKIMLATATTFDDERLQNAIAEALPSLKFEKDDNGNVIVDATSVGGTRGFLNKPGLSVRDIATFLPQMTVFGKVAKPVAGAGIVSNATRVGVRSGVAQTGLDVANQVAGGTEEVSAGNVDKSDVALAGGGGAIFQGLFQTVGKFIPGFIERVKFNGVTDEVRTIVHNQAIKLGLNPSDISDDVIEGFARQADAATNPQQGMAVQGEREFGIKLTAAQRSLDDAALSAEDRLRSGMGGDNAQRVVRTFEKEDQLPAIDRARNTIAQNLGGPQNLGRRGAGETITDAVRQAETKAAQQVDDAYAAVGDAALEPGSINKMYNTMRKAVIGADKDRTLKATAGVLDQLRTSQRVLTALEKSGAKIKPRHINEIETLRRRLNTAVGSAENQTDKAQVLQMKRGLDDFMDDAVVKALFTGDDEALAALKNARSTFAEYARKFRSQPKKTRSGRALPDGEGAFIEKMVEANPTGEETVNAIFGASGLNKTSGVRLAQRFKTIMGQESDGWGAIRQEAFRRLIKTNKINGEEVISGQQTLNAISDAMDKNSSLMSELFTPDEIGLFKRFAVQVKRTQPDLVKSRENPSGTAQVAGKALTDVVRKIGTALAMTGEPTIMASSVGIQTVKGFTSAAKAKSAVKPFEDVLRLKSGPTAAGTATIQAGAN
jgi:hypothetical protein